MRRNRFSRKVDERLAITSAVALILRADGGLRAITAERGGPNSTGRLEIRDSSEGTRGKGMGLRRLAAQLCPANRSLEASLDREGAEDLEYRRTHALWRSL
jgi:hypothetical protein